MTYGLLVLAFATMVVTVALGDDATVLPPAEQRAVAEALLVHHERALQVAAAAPTAAAAISVIALPGRIAGGSSCSDGRTVVTRPDPALPRSEGEDRRLLAELAALQHTGLGVGRAAGGLVVSPVATFTYALPCSIPDGTPVVATLVRP